MSKNIMKEVAKLLGVELNEEFDVKGLHLTRNPYQFKDYGLVDCNNFLADSVLRHLLTEACTIEKTILNENERKYLANVIAPKQIYDRVEYIIKREQEHYIVIKLHHESNIYLVYFEDMFRNMKLDKKYTLEEVRLSGDE